MNEEFQAGDLVRIKDGEGAQAIKVGRECINKRGRISSAMTALDAGDGYYRVSGVPYMWKAEHLERVTQQRAPWPFPRARAVGRGLGELLFVFVCLLISGLWDSGSALIRRLKKIAAPR